MTLEEIKCNCDMAELNGGLNPTEISLATLSEWARLVPNNEPLPTECFDIISVLNMMEQWWKEQNQEPTIEEQMTACLDERFSKLKHSKDAIKSCAYCGENDGCDLFKKKHSSHNH